MANHLLFTIVALVSAAIICSPAFAQSGNSPFVVAHKRVSQLKVKPDLERVSVSIDIYNTGSETAYDVTLTDDGWDKDIFDTISGNTSVSWEKLDSGALVSHSFELESKVKTIFYGVPALITYRVPTKSKLQMAYSTPILPLKILSEAATKSKLDIAKELYVQYSQQAAVVILVVLFVHILTSSPKSSSGKKKKH